MPFLYGNHVVKAHLGRITEDTPEHQGVVIFNMADIAVVSLSPSAAMVPRSIRWQGFGVTARSTIDTRKLDPTSIIVFNQACVVFTWLAVFATLTYCAVTSGST